MSASTTALLEALVAVGRRRRCCCEERIARGRLGRDPKRLQFGQRCCEGIEASASKTALLEALVAVGRRRRCCCEERTTRGRLGRDPKRRQFGQRCGEGIEVSASKTALLEARVAVGRRPRHCCEERIARGRLGRDPKRRQFGQRCGEGGSKSHGPIAAPRRVSRRDKARTVGHVGHPRVRRDQCADIPRPGLNVEVRTNVQQKNEAGVGLGCHGSKGLPRALQCGEATRARARRVWADGLHLLERGRAAHHAKQLWDLEP